MTPFPQSQPDKPIRARAHPDELRARILEVAEAHFRRIGHHKTSIADIAAGLGMSPASIYRFFPSRDAINESICGRVVNESADIAFAIARTSASASEKLSRILTAVHVHNKITLVKDRHIHDLIVAALQENWPVIKAHIERMVTIFEQIIRQGVESGEFEVDDAAEAAQAVKSAFLPFFHPMVIEHCVQLGENSEAELRNQIRFILKALCASAPSRA